ncbi:phosphotransferase [Alphaproteobacteria bacterium GH1-50]|uniref:Phosphotransferase n=1 Tax=Kangsaoukella pontilimi TaxID=2691042 RepID=A0A7C9NH25_9RHOB|nr:fructosamine kinase family protein [Kangsaoukella pontilimi]MXQ09859.1 phosphotransferase [Kangsaoukella pontilimi]
MSAKEVIVGKALELLGDSARGYETLHGGDLSDLLRVQLGSGESVVVKSGPYPDREGRMLSRLADAGANVPRPLASSADVLVLEDLGPDSGATDQSWRALGLVLSDVHSARAEGYGWDEDYAFGSVKIRNGWSESWTDFWVERRLADDLGTLPAAVARRLEQGERRIRDVVPDRPPPALLHGDLWSGNVHFTKTGRACLIDPASYVGHAEVDLAMLSLFGAPPRAFWDAYGPLDDGWQHRRHLYQLWPALVHLRLFGEGYRPLVERLMSALDV